eukprot:CAMPEP_0170200526 /NCGR_PEP_ID=MMETSP0040_2-20121228/69913_1 /TAXON_ID=641309 /ORGANISM="Lotharella oceanica, Strain CCMP622" /LENGTH=57 /DNA_ID=CAMNT_0010450707 /DNA_START=1854 /DNA_END=2027 /DNA_ORIENTATION=+
MLHPQTLEKVVPREAPARSLGPANIPRITRDDRDMIYPEIDDSTMGKLIAHSLRISE